jgi:heme exporter protein C
VVYGAENADAQGDFRVGETMTQVLSWNLVAFCILFSALVVLRWRQLRNEDALAELREEVGN